MNACEHRDAHTTLTGLACGECGKTWNRPAIGADVSWDTERHATRVLDSDGEELFAVAGYLDVPQVHDMLAAYLRALKLGEQVGRAKLQLELRRLLGRDE